MPQKAKLTQGKFHRQPVVKMVHFLIVRNNKNSISKDKNKEKIKGKVWKNI